MIFVFPLEQRHPNESLWYPFDTASSLLNYKNPENLQYPRFIFYVKKIRVKKN